MPWIVCHRLDARASAGLRADRLPLPGRLTGWAATWLTNPFPTALHPSWYRSGCSTWLPGPTTPLGDLTHAISQPRWSPTGKLAYYDQTSQAYIIYDLQTGSSLRLPNQTGQGGSWSPDGRYFVAAEISITRLNATTEVGVSRLLRYDAETGAAVDLTRLDDVEDVNPVFSPDGGLIAFGRKYLDPARWTLGRPLWMMAADGSTVRQVMDRSATCGLRLCLEPGWRAASLRAL